MAVVSCVEVIAGTSVSGKFGESLRATRKWTVRADALLTPQWQIIASNGVSWGQPHPDFPDCQAMEFELSNSDDVGLRWTITVTYYVPPPGKKVGDNGLPADFWEATGSTSVVPAFVDSAGDPIVNSAGDPLEGLERERSEFGWTLTKFYADESWAQDAVEFSNTVNSGTWSGSEARTWKAEFKGAKLKELTSTDDQPAKKCIETHWEFRYDGTTWRSKPWDVGFMELNGSGEKVLAKTSDGKPVKQPVALTSTGSAKAAGEPPDVINGGDGVDLYEEKSFASVFGDPNIL